MVSGSIACGLGAQCENFRIGKDPRRLLSSVKDARDSGIVSGNAVLFQPEQHVGLSAHRADLNHLVEAEEMRGHPAVNGVGELEIIFSESFDERGSVSSSRFPYRVLFRYGTVGQLRGMGSRC